MGERDFFYALIVFGIPIFLLLWKLTDAIQ